MPNRSSVAFYEYLLKHVNERLTKPVSRVQIIPGSEVAWDSACGQLSLRVPNASLVYPNQRTSGKCPEWVTSTAYISLLRCVSTVTDSGKPPSPIRVNAEGSDYIRDMQEVAKALMCFEIPEEFQSVVHSVDVRDFTGLGAQGGMAGGEWSISIRWSFPWLP